MRTQKNRKEWMAKILLGLVLTVTLAMLMPNPAMAITCEAGQRIEFDADTNTETCVDDLSATTATTSTATGQTTAPSNDQEYMKLMEELGKALILVSEFLQRIIWPVLLLIGGLLKNDILFAAGMEETMLAIWRNIRNIVNILFILILLGIAFYNVVGGSSQDYHIKTILPKFVIALIAVNFSFLAVKVVVDGVSVVTTAIFALPDAVYQEMGGEGQNNPKKLTENQAYVTNICEMLYGQGEKYAPPEQDGYCVPSKDVRTLTEKGQSAFRMFDSNNAAIVLAINMGQIAQINKVKLKDFTEAVKSMLLNVLFSTMLYIVYAVAFVAMLIILAVRLVVLWVTMVLSPLVVLAYVVPESLKSSLGGGGELGKKFVQNAIAPIPIALVMSIGFIMLQSWKQARFSAFDIQTLDVNLLTSGMSTLQDLMAAVAMVVVIWVGVFEASKGTYAESIVGGLKTAVEGAGKFVAAAPFKYMPIIPVGAGGDKVSVGTVLGGLSQLPGMLEQRQRAGQTKFIEDTLGIKTDDSVRKSYDKSENGTDVAANWLRYRERRDADTQKKIGQILKDKPVYANDFFRYLQPEYEGSDGKKYKRADIIRDLQAGTLPSEVFDKITADLNKNDTVNTRAGQLAGEAAKAPATAPAAAAGTAAAGAATQQPPPASTVDQQADSAFAGTDDADKIAKNDPAAVARRNKVKEELDLLRQKAAVTTNADDMKATVDAFTKDLDAELQASIPDDTARAARVQQIMQPYVEQMQKNVAPPATTTAPAGQPDPTATTPPDPTANPPT